MPWENNRPTHVPPKVRTACLLRDNSRCTVTMQDGTRCPETTNLEAAHVGRWQPGETTTVNDVVTKCHWHHNRETMQQASAARQRGATRRPSAIRKQEQHPGLS